MTQENGDRDGKRDLEKCPVSIQIATGFARRSLVILEQCPQSGRAEVKWLSSQICGNDREAASV